eukprot:gene17077-22589_t
MEELQDAIEDAQYMNAMHDDTPRPTKSWRKPTAEELQNYLSKLQNTQSKQLDIDYLCEGSLGLYFFMKFAKENGSRVLSDFILDVATYRIHLTENMTETAKKIMNNYLLPTSSGNNQVPEKRPSKLQHLSALPENQAVIELYEGYIDKEKNQDKAKNILEIYGEPVNEVINAVNTALSSLESAKSPSSLYAIKNNIFDELSRVVFYVIKKKYWKSFQESSYWNKYHEFMLISEKPVNEDDFTLFRILGRGGFGLVNGCKRSQTGKLYAMKTMNKKRVKLKKAEALYLMTGGDLSFHLQRKGKFTVIETKYYSARILLGIASLHEQQIVYRDLKPENILMGEDGRTKLSDLGLACKVSRSGLTGTCGTRGYWAPEMLRKDSQNKRERYTLTVDWFSFGCCIYEFLFGISPFRTERARNWGDFPKNDKADKDRAIDTAIKEMEPEFDSTFDDNAKDLILKLLHKDPRLRLGAQGAEEIKQHPWFSSIDWDNIDYIPPPWIPAKDINMLTQSEIGTFADEKSFKKMEMTEADHKQYEKWDFTSIKAYQEELVEFFIYEDIYGPIKPIDPGSGCCTIS